MTSNTSETPLRFAVIGAGWAGCAAAVELAGMDHLVTLFETSRTLGGRARQVDINGKRLDNGQHILLGAYSETLRLMRVIGIDQKQALLRLPLQMRYPPGSGGMDFVAPRLPAPFHLLAALLRARGLSGEDKLALARFSSTARWMDWRLNNDCSVTELLERYDQTDRLIALMWRPLCIAALNTPPERASAQVFLNVLRDSLGARRAASDMLIPRVDMSTLFPQKAASFVEQRGGKIRFGTTVKAIRQVGTQWQLDFDAASPDEQITAYDAVVIATQPGHAASLLEGWADTKAILDLQHESITTCYLQYPVTVKLSQPFFALVDQPHSGEWGQFVFDHGQLDPDRKGLLAVVVSASHEAIASGHEILASALAQQLAKVMQIPELAAPEWVKVITEKRATFSCVPGVVRPGTSTGMQGLVLAGDYVQSDYPSTLESATRSGVQAARLIVTKND